MVFFFTPTANVLYGPIVCFEVGLFFQIIFQPQQYFYRCSNRVLTTRARPRFYVIDSKLTLFYYSEYYNIFYVQTHRIIYSTFKLNLPRVRFL